ncbi:hypothetical protein H696_04979 [Fonticula alba]|uniref:UBX domain-containing protein n=1 Tax=Fonticula alba TaxID=691883 RepID=A0A058Z3H6_FONAL|nr:hypothetical protein H696_04979 [Fonticula alba]KCV68691.1 hypothetical protein H696_04979 [Fonticula alba]|eukprot:XP_009497123.1 hypothetical protein H696_04979 [Fonticula alba]
MQTDDVSSITAMGFSEKRARLALASTGGQGAQAAILWLTENEDVPSDSEPVSSSMDVDLTSEATSPGPDGDQSINSYQCDDCNKQLRNEDAVHFHAHKTGHTNFSESSSVIAELSPEEKAKRLEDLRLKLREAREKREAAEQLQSRMSEIDRRKTGRDSQKAQQEYKERARQAELAQSRAERNADAAYRAQLIERIAREREARRRELAGESEPTAAAPAAAAAAAAPAPAAPAITVDHSFARIQVRMTGAAPLVLRLPAASPLAILRDNILRTMPDSPIDPRSLMLMTSFPRREFTEDDMSKTLGDLGLVPSAAIVASIR